MQTNFHFLKNEFHSIYERAVKAEQFVLTDPRTSLIYSRMAAEETINRIYANDKNLTLPYDTSIHSLMMQAEFKELFDYKLYNELHLLRKTGNLATHNKAVSDVDANNSITTLYYFLRWFALIYSQKPIEKVGPFDYNLLPKEGDKILSKKEIKKLKDQLDAELSHYQAQLAKEKEDKDALIQENELLKQKNEALQQRYEVNKIAANKDAAIKHPHSESETRKLLIDVNLREAGWDLQGANDKEYKVNHMPTSTNKSGTGYVDYVLWDDDGLPLAVVEAKKTLENVHKGENQAQLYAECIEKMYDRRPVMYYSNGYEIYLWDDQFYKKARPVHGFYTKAELQTLMYRRTHRKDIRKAAIDTNIAGRNYQMRAIRSITEHIAGNDKHTGRLIGTNRGALLVLATGTGKTRTAIAFAKLMIESNWAKRVLFLADRTDLVDQAKDSFTKMLPNYSCVNLLEEKDNLEARFAFSTYQTMMRLIDGSKEKDARFYGVGHFDLIIIDEAHRSIYKRYQTFFDYFDALFLGLTATPVRMIDRNTYHVFGLADKTPTDAYPFEQAVKEGFLVPYQSVELQTKFLRSGIKYADLSEEEQAEFEDEILEGEEATGDEWIDSKELNSWLFNKDTAIKTLKYILEYGIKNRSGEELGKTIIFAKNRKHAQFLKDMFLEIDKELFSNDYVKVITHGEPKAKEMLRRFKNDEVQQLPQIAISVDMMDTGIDAPSCVNLVFYKPVKSYAKFWQMIGRGTRLRPNLFGEGKDKTHFIIFDLCQNFEFFKENPFGIEGTSTKSLTELLFSIRLQLAQYLKSDAYIANEELQAFRKELLDELYKEISSLDESRFDVKMNLKTVHEYGAGNREIWEHLSKQDIHTIEKKLAPLVKPKKGDTDLARYYDKTLYSIMKERLETPNSELFMNEAMRNITKVVITSKKILKKKTIPEIKSKQEIIQMPLDKDFWKVDGIAHLEKLRKGVRELTKYIDPIDQRYVTTDFEDELNKFEIGTTNFIEDEKEEDGLYGIFKNTIYRLEKIVRENRNHITISRIKNGEKITTEELKELETILLGSRIKKEELEKELGKALDLENFIISLEGLNPAKVDEAFAQFINEYQLNSVQINFLNTIKEFITQNGTLAPEMLYQDPFVKYHSLGVDGVFNTEQADTIFSILDQFSRAN